MTAIQLKQLNTVISGRKQFGKKIDSKLKAICDALPAAACLKWFATLNASHSSFFEEVDTMFNSIYNKDLYRIEGDKGREIRVALRLTFCNEDACYYQFPVFPPLHFEYISASERKRHGKTQLLVITLQDKAFLDAFTDACNANPHLSSLKVISEEEFLNAPSDGS